MLRFSPSQLPAITTNLSAYEQETLRFCHEWEAGKQDFVLHTSGSTGQPKPVSLSRQQMQASAQMTAQALGLMAGDRALVCLNTRYIAGTMMLVRGMEQQLEMTVIEPGSNPLMEFPAETAFDFTALVPLQLETILAQSPEKLPVLDRMKAILVGGAPVSFALEEKLQVIGSPVYSTYGMTETVSHVALRRLNGADKSASYTALEGVQIGTDSRGCIWVVAPSTAHQTIQTNDLVELTGPNAFRWLGRADNIINSGGVKIQLEKIEQALDRVLTHLNLSCRFLAFGLPHPSWGEMLCVAIESPPLSPKLEKLLRQGLTEVLDRYEIPRQLFSQLTFPETPTGKIDRKKLIAIFTQQMGEQQ